jgi:hypothetical protein
MKRPAFLFWLLIALAGCVHSPSRRTALPPESGNPQLLFLQPAPHRSLYVEVDAVKGTEPSEAELGKLTRFLRQWCDKPDGITIVRSSLIARTAARGKPALALAQEYLDGPPATTNAGPPAYLYILFYDNRINRNPLQSPRAASQWPTRDPAPVELARTENPHVVLFPYPAMIYVDRSWLAEPGLDKYRRESLTHEAGHVLGLVRRESRILGYHCPAGRCVMSSVSENVKSDLLAWLRGGKPKPDFCEGCMTELRQSQTSTNETTMHFIGPVMVRSMPLYQVLALPGACRLYVGVSLEAEVPKFTAEWRSRDGRASNQEEPWLSSKGQTEQNLASLLPPIEAAKQDPAAAVRWLAVQLESALRTKMDRRDPDEAPPKESNR